MIDTHRAKIIVGLDFTTINLVLEAVDFDVVPQGLDNTYPAVFFDPEHVSCDVARSFSTRTAAQAKSQKGT